jgi:hypothetical protein
MHASAQSLELLDLANPAIGRLNWKLTLVLVCKNSVTDGCQLVGLKINMVASFEVHVFCMQSKQIVAYATILNFIRR